MVPKKSSKADLEGKKSLFFEIGLALSMLLVLLAFEWKSTRNIDLQNFSDIDNSTLIDLPPITKDPDEIIKPNPPRLNFNFDRINVIGNEIEPRGNDSIFNESTYAPINPTLFQTEEEEVMEPQIIVQDMPKFGKGGLDEFRTEFVMKNLRYPEEAQENKISGCVYIEFVVERDGSLSSFKSLRNADASLINEAIRVVKMSPKWTPGMHNGKPARVRFTIPINFVLHN